MDGENQPGERRPPRATLERPPGERYAPGTPPQADSRPPPTTARAIALGALVALGGALAIVVLGGVFSLSAGLLVVAGVIGWAVGTTVRANAGPPVGPSLRALLAAALALDAIVLGQLGLWAYSLVQGGALGLVDYLIEARGALIPVEIVIALAVAWWTAR